MPQWNEGLPIRMFARAAAGVASTTMLALLAGCALGTAPSQLGTANVTVGGTVHGGQAPVTNSNIALFVTTPAGTGSSAYGASLTPAATATSDSVAGTWKITTSYSCPAGSYAYVVATGGNPGGPANTDNSALFLVAALGSCGSIGANTFVDINEVTTVAAAYTLGGFAPAGGAGMTEAAITGKGSVPAITASAANAQGLGDAFGNAANIVNIATGQPYTTTLSGTGVVPAATIDALADILQDCVNSTGPSGSSVYSGGTCGSLFSAATPPSGSNIAAPVNVWQAALDIAQYPGNNVSTLYGLISAKSAFPQTTITSAPNDWTIGITYGSTGATSSAPLLVSGTGLGISSNDTVYVSGAGYLLSFSPVGVGGSTNLVSGTGSTITTSDALRDIAFDKNGNLFIADGNTTGVQYFNPTAAVSATNPTLLNFNTAPVLDADPNTYSVAVDGSNNVWTTSYSKAKCATAATECLLVEFTNPTAGSTPVSTFNGGSATYPTGALGGARTIAYDVTRKNVWIPSIDDNLAILFNTTTGTTTQLTGIGAEVSAPSTNNGFGTYGVAIDSTGNAWFTTAGGTVGPVSSSLTKVTAAGVVGTPITGGGLSTTGTANNLVIDGNNNIFIASASSATGAVIAYSPTLGNFLSPNIGLNPSATYSSGTFTGSTIYEPSYLAVDKAGALWVLNSGSGTTHLSGLVQILGVAAPTDPVLADGNYGVKP